MQKNRVAILYVSAIIFVAGCANVQQGRDFDATKAQSFKKGKTSREDVIATMGEPSSTGINSDGSFIEYQYITEKMSGNILSGYGIGTTKVDNKAKLCKFIFDARNTLKDYTCSEGAAKNGMM